MITTSTWQLIVTSGDYRVIAKALDCEEYLVKNLSKWPWSLSFCQCVFLEKRQLQKVSWRQIVCTRNRWWLFPGL